MADHQFHKNIIDQRTQDNNIRNDVKDQVDNTISGYRSEINTTGRNIRDEEQDIKQQYSGLQNHHKEEELSQNRKYHEEKTAQERLPGADTPDELLNKTREYQDKNS